MTLTSSFRSLLLALAAGISVPPAQAESFTYQGKLENAGSPYTGTVVIRLSLYGSLTGGAALRTQTLTGVAVNNGVFSVTPTTFVPADFPGAARYLNIEVSTDNLTFTPLTPRQEVTWSPMALHARVAESVSGSVPAAQLTGTLNPALLGAGNIAGNVTFAPAAGAPFAVGNAGKVINLNSDLFDGLDSSAFLLSAGDTMDGDLGIGPAAEVNFGSQTRQMLNLWDTQYGIGVQGDALYLRSNNDFSWFRGGVHSDLRNAAGSGGTEAMRLVAATSTLWLRPATSLTPRGRLVFGDLNSANSNPYVSIGEAQDDDDTLDITAEKIRLFSNSSGPVSINFGQTVGQSLTLFQNASDSYGIGVQAGTEYFRTGEQFAWYKDGVHNDAAFSPGAGGTTLMTLDSTGNLSLTGTLSTTVLTIRGGADVAEPFEMTRPGEMEAGSVVVIDEENPGRLRLSTEANDARVAGIVSGAGGVQPGLRLHQDGVLEGDHHVALSGRVYVKADAASGPIKPGDLLTTSAIPGHAMKVQDHSKAQGAILGKAMSKLESGTGLVLVLVTLQ